MDHRVVNLAERLNKAQARIKTELAHLALDAANLPDIAEELASSAARHTNYDFAGVAVEAARVAGSLKSSEAALRVSLSEIERAQVFVNNLVGKPQSCKRCGSDLLPSGKCKDETCPYSDRQQHEAFTEG